MELSRALSILMIGLTNNYPNQIEDRDLLEICQLALEVSDRTEAAIRQWHEESAA